MKDFARTKERYLRDPLPVRLGGLAADLARIGSAASDPRHAGVTEVLLEEARRFIEWTAAETDIAVAAELVDLQRSLTLWVQSWPQAQDHAALRALLGHQARVWSDRVLELSGLLHEA
jgi:hypothetical protein